MKFLLAVMFDPEKDFDLGLVIGWNVADTADAEYQAQAEFLSALVH